MHFLRLARDLCNAPVQKTLAPAFFETEDDSSCGFEGITSGIEHALGMCVVVVARIYVPYSVPQAA